jgi:Skp family chaperone for outer membrane proteins
MATRSLKIWLGVGLLGLVTVSAEPAPAQGVSVSDPPIGGVCIYSKNNMLGRSLAGLSAHEQLAQLQQSSDIDLASQRNRLVADERALTGEKTRMLLSTYDRRSESLQHRSERLNELSHIRARQIAETRTEAFGRIAAAAEPLLTASVADHHCAILLDRGAGYSVNPDMDLTSDVISRLNAVMPAITLQLAPPAGGILSQFPHPAPKPRVARPVGRVVKPVKRRCDKACAARLARISPVHGKGK